MPTKLESAVRIALGVCALVAFVALVCSVTACSSADLGSMRAGEACTRSAQCQSDLVCRAGTCTPPAAQDAGADDDDGGK